MTHNLHEFMADTFLSPTADLSKNVHFGAGKSYGIGLTLRKRAGSVTGSVGYRYAWEQNTFPELNGGDPFVPRFSHRHELQMEARVDAGGAWAFGTLCILALTQTWSPQSNVPAPGATSDRFPTEPFGSPSFAPDIFDLSQSRFPGFQRLELDVVRRITAWGVSGEISLRLLNAYGLLDPFAWSLHRRSDLRLKWTADVKQLRLFPLYPALGIAVRF